MEQNPKLQAFHESLVKSNYGVPDYATFEATLKDPVKSKTFYDALVNDKYEMPDYETFVSDLGLKKKDVSEYGLPSSKVLTDIFSKVAGDIPKLETSSQEVTPETTVQYPHWSDVSKVMGIPLPKEVEESGINPHLLGEPQTIGGEKPKEKKVPTLQEIKEKPPKEEIQLSDKTIAKNDVREPYLFTVDDYLKKRGVAPETVGLDPTVNTERLIDVDEKVDFDKKLEAQGLYKPTPQYRESYFGATVNGLYNGTARMIRDIGYLLIEAPQQAKTAMVQAGVKMGAKAKGWDSETTKKYMEQVASAIDNGVYGNTSSITKEGYEGAAKWLESAVKTRTPNTTWGRALENVGAFIPDLISIGMLPEAKAPLLVRWGMQGMLKFPAYLGVKTYVEGAREGKKVKEIIATSAEAAAQGMVFNGLGVWAHEIGTIAKSVGAGMWASRGTEILANSLGFGGITVAQGGEAEQGLLEGLAFSALGAPRMIKEGMQRKAMLNWMTATDNNIRMVAAQKIDPFKLRQESNDLWEKAMALPEGEQRDHLLWQKNMVDNTIDIAFMSNQILHNPDAFIKSINENPMLSAREKKVWVNKVNNTVNMVDPRIIESQPITENIKSLENELAYWNEKTDVASDVKEAKIEALTNQIKEQKEARVGIFEKPLEKYEAKSEKKPETPLKEEIKVQTPEDIAKEVGVTYTGKQNGVNGKDLDLYNVEVSKDKLDTFAVPAGSPKEVVIAKKEETLNKWKPAEKPAKEAKPTTEPKVIKPKRARTTLFKPGSRSHKAMNETAGNFEDAVMQYFISGGRISKEDFIAHSGWGEADIKKSGVGFLLSKNGQKLDVFHEALENSFGMEEKGSMDMINAVIDVVKNNPTRGKMLEAFEKRHNIVQPFQPTEEEIAKQESDEKLAEIIRTNGGLNDKAIEEAVKAGLVSKEELKTFKEDLENENTERELEAREWAAEETQIESELEHEGGDNKIPPGEEPGKGTEKPVEVKPETKPNEEPINKPDIEVGAGEENIVPGSTEPNVKPVEAKGTEKPIRTTDAVKQKQIDDIDKEYDEKIAEAQKELEGMTEEKRNKVIRDAEAEVNRRNTIFGDAEAKETDLIKPGEQGFEVSRKPIEEAVRKFDERKVELTKQIEALNKERESKIGEILKQQTLGFEETLKEVKATPKGIEYKGKTYTDIEQVQDDYVDGKLTLKEQNEVLEKVRKFEKGLKNNAEKNAKDITNRIDKSAGDFENQIKKDIDDKNGKLHLKLFPDLWSALGTVQWKIFSPVRDKLANVIAGQLKKGVTTQTDGIRWSTKVLTNLYNGLLRTQADMHGTGLQGQIGKLEMSGAREYGRYKAKQLIDTWRDLVNGDWDSMNRVWSVIDPTLATRPTEKPLTYGDLGLAEKNLYFALKEWMTWGHETTYANGLIPTKTYLKYKDVTGSSNYIARMYDKYEMDILSDPAIQEFANRGNDSYTSKIAADIYKARKELYGIIEINGREYDSMDSLKEALKDGDITREQYDENKDAIKSDEWRREHAIKDPTYLVGKRVMQTIQNVAIKRYMDAVIANHPEYVLTIPKKAEIPKGFRRMGSSYAWGPFRNKVVASHIVEDLTGFFYQNRIVNTTYDMMKLMDRTKMTQFYKKFRTVYNPFVQLGNATGDVFFATVNGLNPFGFVKGMIENRNISKTEPSLYESLLKSGVIGPVAMTGEMKPMDVLNPKQGPLGKADEWATKVYVGVDNVAKITAYKMYRRQGLTHEQALRRTYDAFQNYATVGKTWDLASKTPLIGPTFVKFQADLQRILSNSMLTTPLTTIGTFMVIKMLGNLASALSGETEEEQAIRENRKGVPRIPFLNIPLSLKVGKAEINLARYATPLYLYNRGDSQIELSELSKFAPFQFQPREEGNVFPKLVFADATWGFLGSLWTDKDFRNVSIQDPHKTQFMDPNTPTDVKVWNMINYVGRSQIPFWKGSADLYNAATGQMDYYDRKRTFLQAIVNNIVKTQQWDDLERKNYVERNLNYLTSKYASLASKMGDAQSVFYKTLQDAEDKGMKDEAFNKVYNVAYRLREKSINKSLREQLPIYKEIEQKTEVYKKWYPNDEFLDKNYQNIESGKVQRFNVLDQIDLEKNHKEVYMLLKKNNMLKTPEMPKYYRGVALTEEEKKNYSNIYWSEYIRQLDLKVGLTQEEFDEYKDRLSRREKADTPEGIKEISKLEDIATMAASQARSSADRQFQY